MPQNFYFNGNSAVLKPVTPVNYHLFSKYGEIHSSATTKISHTVSTGIIRGEPGKVWFCKEMRDPKVAKLEVLGQEFFRFFLPNQPETRLAINYVSNLHYVLSEHVDGFQNLPTNAADKFADGSYDGLGRVMVVALFLQEIDLKNSNLGLDAHNQVIKIDGDWCFAQGRRGGEYRITPKSLAALPYPKDFYAYNWLDLIKEEVNYAQSSIVSPLLSQASQFRAEVNQTILKICLMPDHFIELFVDAYIPAGGQKYVDLIKSRRDELFASAIQTVSYQSYLRTNVPPR